MEELEKMIREVIDKYIDKYEETVKDNKLDEDTKEAIHKLVDNSRAIICVSNRGIMMQGHKVDILACLSSIIDKLIEGGFSEKEIKTAVNLALTKNSEDNTDPKKQFLNSLKDLISEMEK